MRIEQVTEATPELVATIERLLPQLSEARTPPTLEELQQTVDGETMLVALRRRRPDPRHADARRRTASRRASKARIEDVIVDEAARGQGVGEALVREALRRATELGVRTVELTSMPYREAANRLYRRLGFVRKPTNVYVWWPLVAGLEPDAQRLVLDGQRAADALDRDPRHQRAQVLRLLAGDDLRRRRRHRRERRARGRPPSRSTRVDPAVAEGRDASAASERRIAGVVRPDRLAAAGDRDPLVVARDELERVHLAQRRLVGVRLDPRGDAEQVEQVVHLLGGGLDQREEARALLVRARRRAGASSRSR